MAEDIYDPLTAYVEEFRDRFKAVAEETFAELAAEAQVDVKANRRTCRRLYAAQAALAAVRTRISRWTVWCVLLWVAVAVGAIATYANRQQLTVWALIGAGMAVAATVFYLLMRVHPRLKRLKTERGRLTATVKRHSDKAWQQMSPLNSLYDWDVLTRMMAKTVPRLEFDPYFTTQRLADLEKTYGWDGTFNAERSVIYSHSGLINGNPFVICRTRKMEMGTKTYYGTKTIYWTRSERGLDGKYHTVHHSQTLRASVTAPFPGYFEKTRPIYGNTAAPDLVFHRKQSGLASKERSLSFKWKRRSLRKKARRLDSADFAMMTNEEFEVAFDTSDRNDNQQFALLFTPLAQESMLKLLKDNTVGFGDDFDFVKEKMINTIVPGHLQELELDLDPAQYRHYDYDKAQADFYTLNARYFRAIYFGMAPLLCVPMYQQIRPPHDIYGQHMQRHSAFWEHEALANFWGQDRFKHPDCVTDCILKTEQGKRTGGNLNVTVYAHGYRKEQRLTYVDKWGRDGNLHRVPVYWDEYLPVTGSGDFQLREDNSFDDTTATFRQRLEHINDVLGKSHCDVYRRHIASKL